MDFFGYHFNLNITVLANLAFLIFTLFTALVTVIMIWHWNKYALNKKEALLAEVIYLTGLVILGGGALLELRLLV